MSKLPCPQQHIAQVPEADRDKCKPYTTTLPAPCRVRTCGLQATEEHHVVPKWFTRSWAVRDYALLYGEVVPVKVPLCSAHHRDYTENRAWFEFTPGAGFAFWTELTGLTEGEHDAEHSAQAGQTVRVAPSVSSGHDESGLTEGTKGDVPGAIEALSPAGTGLVSASVAEPLPSLSVNPGQSCPACHRRIPYPKVETSPTSAVWSMRMPADAKEDFRGIVDELARHLGAGEERYGAYKAMLTAAVYALQVAPERVLSEIGERIA